MTHAYAWRSDGTVHSSDGPCGLVCVVDESYVVVFWSVRVGDANGLRLGYGRVDTRVLSRDGLAAAKQCAQEHADDVAQWLADHVGAERVDAMTLIDQADEVLDPGHLLRVNAEQRAVLGRVAQWTREYGQALCPIAGSADSFGDGMRAAKQQVSGIVRSTK